MATVTYRYAIAFPRTFDGPRPDWPIDILTSLRGLTGFVDALLPEFAAAWHPPAAGVRRESRRQVIFLDITSATPAAATKTQDAVRRLVHDLKAALAVTGPVTLTRWQVDTETI